jgi:ribosomal protein L12E/L44/L45/RPP1/RPP2
MCIACASVPLKDEYKTLYKISVTEEKGNAGTVFASKMPFYKDDDSTLAIEHHKSAASGVFYLTTIYVYEMTDENKSGYILNSVDVRVDNGRVVTLANGMQEKETKKLLTAQASETLTVRIDTAFVQSLRNANALSVQFLGMQKAMTPVAIGKIKEFIDTYVSN